jgi:3-oxoacyl-[acyl-carrier protein] reductase
MVIGGTGGLGGAFVRELTDHGADVALTYRCSRAAAEAHVEHSVARGRRCLAYALDLRDRSAIEDCAARMLEDFGAPSIVVNCAGIIRDQLVGRMTLDDWDAVLDTNLTGPFLMLRRLLPPMIKRGGGRVVNVASVAGLFGIPGQSNYAASKGGMIAMTRALARELGAFNITVNALAPGYVDTEMTAGLPEARRRRLLQRIPARRFATPEDIVAASRVLLGADGAYITVHVLVVDGGLSA